jgi:quercetin dioxygenase-like cupin family protein
MSSFPKLSVMARWTVKEVAAIPTVSDGGPENPTWYPLQHALGSDSFGANLFVATQGGQILVEDHDEHESGQQELYVVLEGEVAFQLDGEEARLGRGSAVAISDPSVRRSATALAEGTALAIIGAGPQPFRSTWNPAHFSDIPRPG